MSLKDLITYYVSGCGPQVACVLVFKKNNQPGQTLCRARVSVDQLLGLNYVQFKQMTGHWIFVHGCI